MAFLDESYPQLMLLATPQVDNNVTETCKDVVYKLGQMGENSPLFHMQMETPQGRQTGNDRVWNLSNLTVALSPSTSYFVNM
jgi:hypothetical protein